MKRIRFGEEVRTEKMILSTMITNSDYLIQIDPILDVNLFETDHSKKIARMIIEYYEDTGEAPGSHIQVLFDQKLDSGEYQKEDEIAIANILDQLSQDYTHEEKRNIKYLLKVTEEYFSKRDVAETLKKVEALDQNDHSAAVTLLEGYRPLALPGTLGIGLLTDMDEVIKIAFEEKRVPLFRLPGSIGRLLNPDLCRGSFLGFMGREKIGKTWTLTEFACRALEQNNKVAIFQAGDMTYSQQIMRILIRMVNKSNRKRYCGKHLIPVLDCAHNQDDSCNMRQRKSPVGLPSMIGHSQYDALIGEQAGKSPEERIEEYQESKRNGYKPCSFCSSHRGSKFKRNFEGSIWYRLDEVKKPLYQEEVEKKLISIKKLSGGRDLKIAAYDAGALSTEEIDRVIHYWATYEGFVPDVIIVDYADLLVGSSQKDFRHAVNQVWINLRGISQRYDCCLITATQSDAGGLKGDITIENFSEDKRKYAHVTSFHAFNQSMDEKIAGTMRVSTLLSREDSFNPYRHIVTLNNYETGRSMISSFDQYRKPKKGE